MRWITAQRAGELDSLKTLDETARATLLDDQLLKLGSSEPNG